jgi:hypothetical protein
MEVAVCTENVRKVAQRRPQPTQEGYLAMDHKHELLAQLTAQIAAGMIARTPAEVPLDDKAVAKRAMEMAKMILTEARGTPISFFGSSER